MLENNKLRRVSLKHGQLIELADMIRTHAKAENGLIVWHDGWSTNRIIAEAAKRGFICNVTNVDTICKQVMRARLEPERDTIWAAMKLIRQLRSDVDDVMNFLTRQHGPGWQDEAKK